LSPDEHAIIHVVKDMVHHRTVSEETFQTLLRLLGPEQAVDLITLVGYYVMLGSVFAVPQLFPTGRSEALATHTPLTRYRNPS
jgi:hypothetical protein